MASYVQVADLGCGVALTHHIGGAHVDGDQRRVLHSFFAGLVPAGVAGIVVFALIGTLVVPLLIDLARVGPTNVERAVWVTRVALIGGLLRVLGTLPQGALSGMGELSLAAQLDIFATAVGTAVMMTVVFFGLGLSGLVFAGLVGPCVLFLSASAAAFRRIPVGELGSLKGMPAEILRLLRSGAEVQITSLAALALHPAS